MGMRPRVEWMNQTDDRILELLDESGLILSPAVIAVNLEYNRSWISRRISKLVDAGLVESINEGYYRITDFGREYLVGDIDADELEAVISSYFKMNERLSQKHGEPARHSIPLTLQQRHQKLEETFDAYPTPSISDEDVDLINRINIKDSNSKRLKKGLIQYSTTWRDSTTLIVHLLYNNTEDRPLNYGNLHHQVIYLNREEHTRANMPRELRVQPR